MEEQKHQDHLQDIERDHCAVDAVDCLPAGFPIIAVAQVDPDHGVVPQPVRHGDENGEELIK